MGAPPKPRSRPEGAGILTRLRLFREDMFASQPDRLYGAWMAAMRTPFRDSFLVNEPGLVREVLTGRPGDFPKAEIIGRALSALLGRSVFVTNGAEWQRQRRLIDPAFEGGRLRDTFPGMLAASEAAVARLLPTTGAPVEIEAEVE
ncbi:MAG TPA: cytochrome P450, partial [Paracoccaceae bacterium]|nr:cytochrome P450 [Paracoccaceae bacterium]